MGPDFTELLNRPIRWPAPGDAIFAVGEKNARLTQGVLARFVVMADGYRKAGDALVERALGSAERDFVIYPILFCYRHFFELSLKYLLHTYDTTRARSPESYKHDLVALWEAFASLLALDPPIYADPTVATMERLVREMSAVDSDSFAFRYPTHMKGRPIEFNFTVIDLENLRAVIAGASAFFDGADGLLSSRR